MTEQELFISKVIPIMDDVRRELDDRCRTELADYMNSRAYRIASVASPLANTNALDQLRLTGEWNSKTADDYVVLVADRLKSAGVEVTPGIQEMMIEKMARDDMPKSTMEYIIRKAASTTLFSLPQQVMNTPLEQYLQEHTEALYAPTRFEKTAGVAIGSALDCGWLGVGGVKSAAVFVGSDLAMNAIADRQAEKRQASVILASEQQEMVAMAESSAGNVEHTVDWQVQQTHQETVTESEQTTYQTTEAASSTSEQQENAYSGWSGVQLPPVPVSSKMAVLDLLNSFSSSPGTTLSSLPDVLLGVKDRKSIFSGNNILPVALLLSSLFTKQQPKLKMLLLAMGGVSLLRNLSLPDDQQQTVTPVRYKQYAKETLNSRITKCFPDEALKVINLEIDGTVRAFIIPPEMKPAIVSGALPLETLANRILEIDDKQREEMSSKYAQATTTTNQQITSITR